MGKYKKLLWWVIPQAGVIAQISDQSVLGERTFTNLNNQATQHRSEEIKQNYSLHRNLSQQSMMPVRKRNYVLRINFIQLKTTNQRFLAREIKWTPTATYTNKAVARIHLHQERGHRSEAELGNPRATGTIENNSWSIADNEDEAVLPKSLIEQRRGSSFNWAVYM